MKRTVYIISMLLIAGLILNGCLKRDPGDIYVAPNPQTPLEIVKYNMPEQETVTIDGVDYLISRGKTGRYGGDLVTSNIGEGPKTFNPFNSNDNTSGTLSSIMYDGLLTTNPYTGEVELKMAKRLDVLDDDVTYIIELRHGLRWSDGKEITADDVVFTFDTIIFGGYGNTSARDIMYVDGKLPVIEKIDKYTVKFTTPAPFAPFLRNLSSPIAPKHVFKPVTDKGKEYFRTFQGTTTPPAKFVTSGAFRIKEYVPAQRVVYERNPNYYVIDKNGNKLPYLDRWIVLIVGDQNNEIIKFEGGAIDAVSIPGSMVSRYREMEKKSDYKLYNLGPTTTTTFMVVNMNTRKDTKGKYYVEPKKQVWFNDVNFRTAIDLALDRDSLVLNVLSGVGQPLFSAESLSSIFLNEEVAKGHKRDIEKARELLKESGFELRGSDLYDKNGNRVEFELLTNAGNTQREATGVSVKEDLAQLGIKVNFKPIEFNSLVDKISNSLSYDIAIIALTGSPLEPNSGYNVWNSNGSLHIFNQRKEHEKGQKLLPFEKELDEIYKKGALELDFDERKELYNRYQEIVYKEKPMIYLFSPISIVAVRKKFGNIYPTTLGGITHNIEEIYIEN